GAWAPTAIIASVGISAAVSEGYGWARFTTFAPEHLAHFRAIAYNRPPYPPDAPRHSNQATRAHRPRGRGRQADRRAHGDPARVVAPRALRPDQRRAAASASRGDRGDRRVVHAALRTEPAQRRAAGDVGVRLGRATHRAARRRRR